MRELIAYWSSLVGGTRLAPDDETLFQQEYRRRSYRISLFVLLISSFVGTVLLWLSYTGHGVSPGSDRDLWLRLSLLWAAPACLLVSHGWSERWYPWVTSVSVTASLSYYLMQGFYRAVINDELAAQDQLFQFQMRTVVVTFFITTLLQLPFLFALVLATANYLVFAAIQMATHHADTPYVLVRIGLLVALGIFVAWIIESRERTLFAARLALERKQKEAEQRLQQYLDTQEAAVREIKGIEEASKVERERRLYFIRDMLHDMRNTIGAIGSNLENYETALAKKLPDMAELATQQVRRSYNVTNTLAENLFDMASYELGRAIPCVAPVDVGQMVIDVAASLRYKAVQKGFNVVESIPRRRRLVCQSHRASLQRVLINLVNNAIKFTRRSSGGGEPTSILIRAVQNGRYIDIHIFDRGIGIEPHRHDEIWEYGKTTQGTNKEQGHGIGLPLVRVIAQSLPEHSVSFRSTVGAGSRFSIRVPVAEAEEAIDVEPAPLADTSIDGLNVLLIDDDEEVLESEKLIVRLCGASPIAADSADAAKALLTETKTTPALIVADFHLKDGEKGTDAIRAVRSLCGQVIPAIIVTSDSTIAPLEAIGQMERVSVLRKPLKRRMLIEEAGRLMAQTTALIAEEA